VRPVIVILVATTLTVAFIGAAYYIVEAFRDNREADAQIPPPGGKCAAHCGKAPVREYQGENYCQDCADELAAYDQRLMDRARDREVAELEAIWRGEVS
jgi:hypothetical protein